MFERYTDRARRVVGLAQEEAAGLGHDSVGTEHLLLGLLNEGGGTAFRALDALEVTAAAAGAAVCRRHPAGTARREGHLPFTEQFRNVQEFARRESVQLGYGYIGTEHLLLGLIREDSGTGALALADCGEAEEDRGFSEVVRAKVLELLRGYEETGQRKAGPGLARDDGPVIAELFASWAQREGILARVTREQCADLAKAFMFWYAHGAGQATADTAMRALYRQLCEQDLPGDPPFDVEAGLRDILDRVRAERETGQQ